MSARFPFPVPTGWFAVAWSDELAPGEVRELRYFARDLVLFRTAGGSAHVLDAFCPHLGAHLAQERVEGDTLVCPFHAWAWDGGGRCTHIPYSRRVPPNARTRAWPVVERSGAILVWHDAAGGPPTFDVPAHPELDDPAWLVVERHEFRIATCLQEIAENAHDPAHFSARPRRAGRAREPLGVREAAAPPGEPRDGAIARFRSWASQFYPGEPAVAPVKTRVEAPR